MPKIKVCEAHSLDLETIKERISAYLDKLRDVQMKSLGFEYKWANDKAFTIKGKGFKGNGSISDSEVDILIDLSMMLTPFKSQVETSLNRGLAKVVKK